MKEVLLYKGHRHTYHIELTSPDDDTVGYTAEIYNRNARLLGRIDFFINENKTWISSIRVQYSSRYNGVGQSLLDVCEYVSAINDVEKISGLYSPSNSYAKEFYLKNNYTINEYDIDSIVEKKIDAEDVIDRLRSRFSELSNDDNL